MVYNIIVNTNSIVLIDCSYYIFYRYFATLRWFKFKNIEFDIQFICENETFIEAFTKHFINDINKICKKWKIKKENIIMCLDCLRNDIWRNDIIDNYKGKRLQSQQFNKNIFDIFKNKINKDIIQISSDRLEADDVAAIIHNKIRSLYKEQKIIIITNDNDYLQLVSNNTTIYNMQMKDIYIRNCSNEIDNLNTPENILFIKAFLGDKSDNIPKITGITKKKLNEIIKLNQEDRDILINNSIYKDDFNRNMKLIDFNKIPEELVKKLLDNIEINI